MFFFFFPPSVDYVVYGKHVVSCDNLSSEHLCLQGFESIWLAGRTLCLCIFLKVKGQSYRNNEAEESLSGHLL